MSFAAAERATTQPDATTDRAANALRQLRQNVALLERLCDMVDSAGPAGADAELRQQVAVQRGVVEDLARATRRHLTELLRDAENSPPATAPRRRAAHVPTGVVPFVFLRRVDGVEGGARSAAAVARSRRLRDGLRWTLVVSSTPSLRSCDGISSMASSWTYRRDAVGERETPPPSRGLEVKNTKYTDKTGR